MFFNCFSEFDGEFFRGNVLLEVWVWSPATIVLLSEGNVWFLLNSEWIKASKMRERERERERERGTPGPVVCCGPR